MDASTRQTILLSDHLRNFGAEFVFGCTVSITKCLQQVKLRKLQNRLQMFTFMLHKSQNREQNSIFQRRVFSKNEIQANLHD